MIDEEFNVKPPKIDPRQLQRSIAALAIADSDVDIAEASPTSVYSETGSVVPKTSQRSRLGSAVSTLLELRR